MRTFVLGDIHGCYDELSELLLKINLRDEDLLISVGDIVDRGPKSVEVFDLFRRRKNSVVLMGNHERKHLRQTTSYSQEIVKLQFGNRYAELLEWIKDLPYYFETESALMVHAGFEEGKSISGQREDVLCGCTSGEKYLQSLFPENSYWTDHYKGNKPVIFGHHVTGDLPEIKNNTFGIDTGCCHGGYLTAIELPGFIIHQVKAGKDYWKEELVKWQIPVLEQKDWMNMSFVSAQKEFDKLKHVTHPDTRTWLDSKEREFKKDQELLLHIKVELDRFIEYFIQAHGDRFREMAIKHPLKNILFKSRHGKISIDYLQSSLNSRKKLLDMSECLFLNNN